uniref:Uncharacterized protein n=1 Tax=Sipha flava TaxID=143950 RepID=A0A2S2QLD5_9HEMI
MIPIFRLGNETSNSAAVESSFRKLKNITFKNVSLPTNIENFIEHHTASLKGSSLLRLNRYMPVSISTEDNFTTVIDDIDDSFDNVVVQSTKSGNNSDEVSCLLCVSGSLQTENRFLKCNTCGISVHAISSCSTHKQGQDNERICLKCFKTDTTMATHLSEENIAVEKWNKKSKKNNVILIRIFVLIQTYGISK